MKLGLLGEGISYSLSPLLHKTILDQLGLPFSYQLLDGDFENVIEKAKHLDGFNVTVPFKEQILSKLSKLSIDAMKIGAVNTVTVNEDGISGYNTDFLALKEIFSTMKLKGEKVLILGCGGVAKAFCHLLQDSFVTVGVRNLNSPRLASLKDSFKDVKITKISQINEKFNIVINATSEKGEIVSLSNLSPEFVFDVIYSEETALLKEGRKLGLECENGLKMLFLQGAFAESLFLNKTFSKPFVDECFEIFKTNLKSAKMAEEELQNNNKSSKNTKKVNHFMESPLPSCGDALLLFDDDVPLPSCHDDLNSLRPFMERYSSPEFCKSREETCEDAPEKYDPFEESTRKTDLVTFKKSVLKGEFFSPTSKSQLHRILLVAYLKKRRISVSFQMSKDIFETLEILKILGTNLELVAGEDFHSLKILSFENLDPNELLKLHVNESGTTLRLTLGVLATLENPFELTLGGMLKNRPHHIIRFLKKMKNMVKKGDKIFGTQGRSPETTLTVDPTYSTQFVTGALLALHSGGTLHIKNPRFSGYIDMTIDVLMKFGTKVEKRGNSYILTDQTENLKEQPDALMEIEPEGDCSQASYFLLEKGVTCKNLNPSSKQGDKKILEILQAFPSQNVFDCSEILDLVPTLVALSLREGKRIKLLGLANLAGKETNRLHTITDNLERNNGPFVVADDTLEVFGQIETCNFHSFYDHRIAMAFAMVALKFGGSVSGFSACNKSYPDFLKELKKLGGDFEKC